MELVVYTLKDNFVFHGEDAQKVKEEIDGGGLKDTAWTAPIKLRSGNTISFSLVNIIALEVK